MAEPESRGRLHTVLAGEPTTEVTGVITSWTASIAVLRKAMQRGANTVICRQSPFYSHGEKEPVAYRSGPAPSLHAQTSFGTIVGTVTDASGATMPAAHAVAQKQRHNLVTNYGVDLPFGRGHAYLGNLNRGANAVLGGWRVHGITIIKRGLPLAFVAANNGLSQFGGGTAGFGPGPGIIRPSYIAGCSKAGVGDPHSNDRVQHWFNTSCFTQPGNFSFGNEPRVDPNLKSEGLVNFDVSASKTFDLVEVVNCGLSRDLRSLQPCAVWPAKPEPGIPRTLVLSRGSSTCHAPSISRSEPRSKPARGRKCCTNSSVAADLAATLLPRWDRRCSDRLITLRQRTWKRGSQSARSAVECWVQAIPVQTTGTPAFRKLGPDSHVHCALGANLAARRPFAIRRLLHAGGSCLPAGYSLAKRSLDLRRDHLQERPHPAMWLPGWGLWICSGLRY